MTGVRDRDDFEQVLRDLADRVRILETASPLNNSSISTTPGIAVRVPDGIDVKPGGSVSAGDVKIGNTAGTGSVKAGTTELSKDGVGSGGTKIGNAGAITNSDGEVKFLVNVKGNANGNFDGIVRGFVGVEAPIDGVMTSLGPAVKEADRKGQSGYDNAIAARNAASAAQSTANSADTKAGTAQSRADSAWNLANGRVTQDQYNTILGYLKTVGAALDELNKQVTVFHPGKPGLPPFYKG